LQVSSKEDLCHPIGKNCLPKAVGLSNGVQVGRRVILFLVLAFLCAGVAFYIFYPTDENRIRKILSNCEKAIVSEDIDGFMDAISFNYSDDYGNNYLLIKNRMQSAFKRFDNIAIEKSINRISVKDDNAEAELLFRVSVSAGEEREYIIGDAGEPQTVVVYFSKSSYKWLIIQVDGVFEKNKNSKIKM